MFPSSLLESLIQPILTRKGEGGGESTVVSQFCAQMREFGIRGGNIEWRPIQDDQDNSRLKFFTRLVKHNKLKHRLNHVMDLFCCRGEILWYVQPDPKKVGLYNIEFFVGGLNNPDPQYRLIYEPGGREIEKVIVRYSYEQDLGVNFAQQIYTSTTRWVSLVITREKISYYEGLNKPDFTQLANLDKSTLNVSALPTGMSFFSTRKEFDNPFYPLLPISISVNNARQLGQSGSDDLYPLRSLIEAHENLVRKAHKNLSIFANPSLVTTRSAEQVLSKNPVGNTWASVNRYIGNGQGSTSPLDVDSYSVSNSQVIEGTLPTVIGNVGEAERFQFIQADAVNGDQNLWIKQMREAILWALGSVDPLGISASATAFEIKSLFGRVQNTSDLKADALFGDSGLATVFELILQREEKLFKGWLFTILQQNVKGFNLESPEQLTDEDCQALWQLKKENKLPIPDNPVGIIPLGDREVTWRYTREVFLNSTREMLERSIAARNEREDGLSQEWVLRKLYPNMTDQEIRNAMSGFSPRVVQNALIGIQGLLQIFPQFMSIPDPESEDKDAPPWGVRLGIPALLEQALLTLRKEIAYGQPVYETAEEEPLSIEETLAKLSTRNK